MHPSASHNLFFDKRRPLWQSTWSLVLTVVVLLLNSNTNMAVSLVAAGVGGILLLLEYVRGTNRINSTLTLVLSLLVLGWIGGSVLNFDIAIFLEITSRIVCGIIWILWLGTQVDWVSLR